MREAAQTCRGVSPTTACQWSRRWREASVEEQRSLACLLGSLVAAERMPRLLPAREQRRICAARRQHRLGAAADRAARPVIRTRPSGGCCSAAGLSRPPRPAREQARRYEWPCPGDLLHIDIKRSRPLHRPGHAVTGDRHRTGAEKRMRVGYEWVHSLVDDHSPLAYSELHRDDARRR